MRNDKRQSQMCKAHTSFAALKGSNSNEGRGPASGTADAAQPAALRLPSLERREAANHSDKRCEHPERLLGTRMVRTGQAKKNNGGGHAHRET